METPKRYALRNPLTQEFLTIDGTFTKEFKPNVCLVRLHESDGKFQLEHDRLPRFLTNELKWEDGEQAQAESFSLRHDKEDFVKYVQVEVDAEQVAHLKTAFQVENNQLELSLEERDEEPIEMYPLGSYQTFSNEELKEISKAMNGGKDLNEFYRSRATYEDGLQMEELVKKIGGMTEAEAENAWISAETMDGTKFKFIKHGTAKIICAPQSGYSKRGQEIADRIRKENVGNPDYKEMTEVVYIFKTGGESVFQNTLCFAARSVLETILSGLIVKGINAACRNLVLWGVRRQLTEALALGLENAMTQGLWYVRFQSFLATGTRVARLVGGCLNLITTVIFIVALDLLLRVLWKPQYLTTQIMNFSDTELLVSLPYTSNVPDYLGENDPETPYVLGPKLKAGDVIYEEGMPIRIEDNVVFCATYQFENDNTFMEGFSMLYKMHFQEISDSAYSKISIPYSASNNMGMELHKGGSDYKQIYKDIKTVADLSLRAESTLLRMQMGINALKGNDNQYQAIIKMDTTI